MATIRYRGNKFTRNNAVIKVIGVGGGGGNAVNRMVEAGIKGIDFISFNTDAQALMRNKAHCRQQLGPSGLGVGGDPEKGRRAAEESEDLIREIVSKTDLIFVTAGMGGGTGTGAAPVVARIAREVGGDDTLVVGVVTRPFHFEGSHKAALAEAGIKEMRNYVDSLLIIPNERLFEIIDRNTTTSEAYKMADEVLRQAIRGISEVITLPSDINVDFNDVKRIMAKSGEALIGIGEMSGENRHMEAAKKAIESPLLENASLDGARGLIVHFLASSDQKLHEVNEVMEYIKQNASKDVIVKKGESIDEGLGDTLRITVIATGFNPQSGRKPVKRLQSPITTDFDKIEELYPSPEGVSLPSDFPQDFFTKPAYIRRQNIKKPKNP